MTPCARAFEAVLNSPQRQDCEQAGPGFPAQYSAWNRWRDCRGKFVQSLFGKKGVTGLNLYSMLVAVAGSVVVLLIYKTLTGQPELDIADGIALASKEAPSLEIAQRS